MDGLIQLDRDGQVATVTVNRPAKLNALTMGMYEALGATMSELSGDDGVRVVVLKGAGDRAFSSGSDIGDFDTTRSGIEQAKDYARRTNAGIRAIRDCRHPTVASIGGICVGGGLEVAAACDIRIASDDSRFGIPANRLGLTVDYEELEMIADLAGRRAALEIVLEGRIFGADEALRRNLVSRVVPRAGLDAAVADTVGRIAAAAPLVNRWHKAFARRLADPAPLSQAELDMAYDCYETADYLEGTRAFAEKRPPEFTGR
jgi:enoyl-CoA hydratase